MGRRKPKKNPKIREYDPTIWQFQLQPISEMEFDEFIAMDAYYANLGRPANKQSSEESIIDEDPLFDAKEFIDEDDDCFDGDVITAMDTLTDDDTNEEDDLPF